MNNVKADNVIKRED